MKINNKINNFLDMTMSCFVSVQCNAKNEIRRFTSRKQPNGVARMASLSTMFSSCVVLPSLELDCWCYFGLTFLSKNVSSRHSKRGPSV